MGIAALIAWLLTAAGGFYLLATWLAKGGRQRDSHFPPALILGHFALAAAGLVLWIIYVLVDNDAVGWTAFVLLVPVALLGFVMFARWVPTYRRAASTSAGPGTAGAPALAEKHFPVAVVAAHGVLAVVTVVLVLLTDLGIGGG
jgi:hypothetical protein